MLTGTKSVFTLDHKHSMSGFQCVTPWEFTNTPHLLLKEVSPACQVAAFCSTTSGNAASRNGGNVMRRAASPISLWGYFYSHLPGWTPSHAILPSHSPKSNLQFFCSPSSPILSPGKRASSSTSLPISNGILHVFTWPASHAVLSLPESSFQASLKQSFFIALLCYFLAPLKEHTTEG